MISKNNRLSKFKKLNFRSLFNRHQRPGITLPSTQQITNQYLGRWYILDRAKNIQHTIELLPNFNILIDNTPFDCTLIELSKSNLILRDKFGYLITVNCEQSVPKTLYDEAENRTFDIEK